MTIKYYLVNNPLTPDPRECRAQVKSNGTKTLDDAIHDAAEMGTLVTKTDLKAVTEILFEVMTRYVANGFNLVTPLCNIKPSIRGVFPDTSAPFNRSVHKIKPKLSAGLLLREVVKNAIPEKVEAGIKEPNLLSLLDNKSGLSNVEITPVGMALLSGYRLSFDPSDPEQGLYFVGQDSTATKVSEILIHKPTEIAFAIPASLTRGHYVLELRSRVHSKALRVGRLKKLEVK